MKKYIQLLLILFSTGLFSCDKFLEPIVDGSRLSDEELMANPAFVEGLLMKAYGALPNGYNFNLDVVSDDAVTNLQASAYSAMSTGAWKSSYNPISKWEDAYEQIYHINLFIEKFQTISWSFDVRLTDAENVARNQMHIKRLKGEAYGLRAYFEYLLLQFHAGKSSDGTMLGFPIITDVPQTDENWKLPRATFTQCVQQIFNDLDTAIMYLPAAYADIAGNGLHNLTMGIKYENRLCGKAARAIKSRVALLAASPSFSGSSNVTWAQAAAISGELLRDLGAIDAAGKTFYNFTTVRPKEILWEQAVVQSRSAEVNNFPPSLFGNGRTNPTQSLVETFPMKNGYPIDHALSGFDEASPYSNRDTRLGDYILYNGSVFKTQTINTYAGADLDGTGTLQTSTRTGYYIRKFMASGVSLTPGSLVSTSHSYVHVRMTEVIMNYIEAANEAWGPDGDPNGYGFTARFWLGEIRKRAGITAPDPYLASIADAAGLRELIHNERRIELCFEGFRFWDIRRWDNATVSITEPANGVFITNNAGVYEFENVDIVESRNYFPYMIYGPIPYSETLKYDLVQNAGW